MRLLVLGGTRFVGRAVVDEALQRGWDVTALHRGVTGQLPDEVTTLHADRTDGPALEAALADGWWDAVVDTWDGAPRVATGAARLLAGRAERYAYVSSGSVYAWGAHVDEDSRSWTATPQPRTATTRRSSAAPSSASWPPSPERCWPAQA